MKSSKHKNRKSIQRKLNKIVKDINIELKDDTNGRFTVKQKSFNFGHENLNLFIWKWHLVDWKEQVYWERENCVVDFKSPIAKRCFIVYLQAQIQKMIEKTDI